MGGGGAPNQLQPEILVIPPPVSSGLAFEFQQLGTAIQEQSNLNACGSQIIDDLYLVRLSERLDSLKFEDYAILHQHISREIAHRHSFVVHLNRSPRLNLHPSPDQLIDHCFLLHRLQKTGT